ncbi:hypothetical protein [Deinococcus sp. AJ005]|nr:hypothetical protein [Deinococcus sp. AJ005]
MHLAVQMQLPAPEDLDAGGPAYRCRRCRLAKLFSGDLPGRKQQGVAPQD